MPTTPKPSTRRAQLRALREIAARDARHVEAFPGARLDASEMLARLLASPLTGGNAPPPAGGLFDQDAARQIDLFDQEPKR